MLGRPLLNLFRIRNDSRARPLRLKVGNPVLRPRCSPALDLEKASRPRPRSTAASSNTWAHTSPRHTRPTSIKVATPALSTAQVPPRERWAPPPPPPYQADVDQGRDASAVHRPGAPGRLRALPCVHVVDQVEAAPGHLNRRVGRLGLQCALHRSQALVIGETGRARMTGERGV